MISWKTLFLNSKLFHKQQPTTDFETRLQHIYQKLLTPGAAAIDIGAHVGRHTVPMAKTVGPSGWVLAVEPLAECQQPLLANLKQAGVKRWVDLIDCALSDYNGESDFIVAQNLLEYSGLRERVYDAPTQTITRRISVLQLDDLPLKRQPICYIKIDAEGGELSILRGGVQLIGRDRPIVSFEFGMNSARSYNVTPEEMYDFWVQLGFLVIDILGHPLTRETFSQSAVAQKVWDYFAVPAERTDLPRYLRQ